MPSLPALIAGIDRRCTLRNLSLTTTRSGPLDLGKVIRYHVQGIARSDLNGKSRLAVSVSGEKHGLLWFADFDRDASGQLASAGRVTTVTSTKLPHPGGMQASGHLLAVACEADSGFARIEIYDLTAPGKPIETLILDGSRGEGVSQKLRSSAGWLAFAEESPGQYLLFVGGRSFAQREGWFYRYRPSSNPCWEFLGDFIGSPLSEDINPWGPQSGAAMLRVDAAAGLELVTFGSKGTKGRDAYRTRVRCYGVDVNRLTHRPELPPRVFTFPGAQLEANLFDRFGPNARWGSSAFLDGSGGLLAYFTARNPRPLGAKEEHVLRIAEVRAR